MSWDAIGAIGEIVGALAVLITLVYLAIQVRESGKANTLNAFQTNRQARLSWFNSNMDSPHIPAIFEKIHNGEELNFQEQFRFNQYCSISLGLIYSEWVQRKMSIGEDFLVNTHSSFGPKTVDYWRTIYHIYPQEFVEFLEHEISHWESGK